jgi:hypothetical protein
VLNGAETDFYERRFLNPSTSMEDILLNVTHPADSHKLIIQNGDTKGEKSEIIIRKIALYSRPEVKPQKYAAAH